MPKRDMNDLLKKRMSATQQAAEIVVGDEAYETLFRGAPAPEASRFCDLPIERLRPFFTADIGFRPYPPEKLKAFSQQLAEQGIYERVIVRPISGSNDYEILAGHNRTKAWQMSGHDMIPAEVVSADDARAVSIAVATNLLRRQDLTIIERGKAYRALLRENNRHGQWDANQAETTFGDSRQKLQEGDTDSTFGENRQRYNARKLVADFFGVTEYEIRKAIKLASLIGPLAEILESTPRRLPIACAELIADYDAATQQAFVAMCSIEGYADTMQAKAMKLMASKLAVAGIIEGTFSEEGLAAMSDVKDLTSQMAKELALGIRDNVEDIAAAFRKMAVMNPERKKNIAAAQLKETAAEEQKAPAAKDSFGVRTAQAQVRQALYEGLLARTAEEQKKRKSKKAEVDENQLSIFGFAA